MPLEKPEKIFSLLRQVGVSDETTLDYNTSDIRCAMTSPQYQIIFLSTHMEDQLDSQLQGPVHPSDILCHSVSLASERFLDPLGRSKGHHCSK